MEQSSITQRFFVPEQVKPDQLTTINCGRTPNSLFRAIAVSLIDAINHAARFDDGVLKQVLNSYFIYYPQSRNTKVLMTVRERYEALKLPSQMPELVETMAFILRQMAVDELLIHPEKYPLAFLEGESLPSVEQLRSEETFLNEHAVQALANALNMPMGLSLTDESRELPLSLEFNLSEKSPRKPELRMGLVGNQALSKVRSPQLFSTLASRKAHHIKAQDIETDKTIERSFEVRLNQFIDSTWDTYEHMLRSLKAAVSAGEVTKEQLLERYISAFSASPETGLSVDRGTERLMNAIYRQKEQDMMLPDSKPEFSQDVLVVEALCKALARLVCTAQLGEDELFEEQAFARHQG